MAKKASKTTEGSETPSNEKAAKAMNFVRPFTDCPVFYSNIGQVASSSNEVRLVLCQAIDQSPEAIDVNPQVVVYLPHEHAKRLADVILQQLGMIGFQSKG